MHHIVALSGGKDSTAMALRLMETEPREYTYLCTPTGDEFDDMLAHWDRLETLLGQPLIRLTNGTLNSWIEHFHALPNWRQRWCTRLLKIEPCIAFLKTHQPATLYVGLRADEDAEDRTGLYGPWATYRYPLREWEWDVDAVWTYLNQRGIIIPERTDCRRCYGQRLIQWKRFLARDPAAYAEAEAQEAATGATFRSPGRDTWPAGLAELRVAFASGRKLRGEDKAAGEEYNACQICLL